MLRLPPMPRVSDILKIFNLQAKQNLSQNFLLDGNLTDIFARAAAVDVKTKKPSPLEGKIVIEVGPGPGSLTRSILKLGAKKVIGVEKDKRFFPALEALQQASDGRFEFIIEDMMRVDEKELLKKHLENTSPTPWEENSNLCLMGNLPFNVGTQILLKWIRQLHHRSGAFEHGGRVPMVLMFQKELADRIVAPVGVAEYGRLSVMVGQVAESKIVHNFPGKVFVPPPDVACSCVKIVPRIKPISFDENTVIDEKALEYVLRKMFNQRRKTSGNCVQLLDLAKEEGLRILSAAGVKPIQRPQEITISQWCRIAHEYLQIQPIIPLGITPEVRIHIKDEERKKKKERIEKENKKENNVNSANTLHNNEDDMV